ncbi:hypothetical protein ACTMTJ_40500 [Phytohabitans sp. LJ34]|uniref:hypothetical protein n=1 Tax=Phytohabitans sp. LJ34 TaxID=3452217 RepID=UPI003F8B3482
MNDTDSTLRDAIHGMTEGVLMKPDTASAAIASGRRIRSRRRLRTSLLASAAVVSLAIGVPYAISLPGDEPVGVPPAPPPTLPDAPGEPGAAQRPDLVGADAGILHFDVDLSGVPGLDKTSWQTMPEGEWLRVYTKGGAVGDTPAYTVEIPRRGGSVRTEAGADERQVSVHGRPATLRGLSPTSTEDRLTWQLVWQPADGLTVSVLTTSPSEEALTAFAEAIRLDRAQRCAQPVLATHMPAGAKLERCSIELDGISAWARTSSFTLVAPAPYGEIQVSFAEQPLGPTPNRTVAGRPAMWSDQSDMLIVFDYFGDLDLEVFGQSEQTVTDFVEGLDPAEDLQNPQTWQGPM